MHTRIREFSEVKRGSEMRCGDIRSTKKFARGHASRSGPL
jgi:hypothetical protein